MSAPLLEARGVTKTFPGVVALKDVSFDVRAGEIHALCGENGAGKSTLIKLLSGVHPFGSYDGELLVDGAPARFLSVADAQKAGIAAIAQELALIPALSVAENVRLGDWPTKSGLVDWAETRRDAREWLTRLGLDADIDTPVEKLSAGERQLVEIAKALRRRARVLILDEPTAALGVAQSGLVLRYIKQAAQEQGIGVIFITHNPHHAMLVGDHFMVLARGEVELDTPRADLTLEKLTFHMAGGNGLRSLEHEIRGSGASGPSN